MSHVTTHVLDSVHGQPATGLTVSLLHHGELLAQAVTDADGRASSFGPDRLEAGTYEVVFATGAWFGDQGIVTFYPEVRIAFSVAGEDHYHVPLLLSPFAYSTYRGS